MGFLRKLTSLRNVFLLEAIRVDIVATVEEDLMLPVLFKFVNQVLDLETDSGLYLGVVALTEH